MGTSSQPARRRGSRSRTGCRSGRDILRAPDRLRRFGTALLLAFAAAGCGPRGTPEDEIRALVSTAEESAEARDASALRDLVADDYEDPAGRTADDLRNYIHGWLVAHPSVRLITRVNSIELEGNELARLSVTIGMLGREASSDSGWEFAGDVWRFDLRLARDSGDWRVIRAGWQQD
ncbi:MAG TPA: hypothetical protein VH856_00140 [Steroidobacteraceae bacterium]